MILKMEIICATEILNFENRTIISRDMTKNVSEGKFGVNFLKIIWGRTPRPPI